MTRALLVVMDSVGIGGAPDAAAFGDEGSNTVGHILDARGAMGLALPNLAELGLFQALAHSSERAWDDAQPRPNATWAVGREVGRGKDTPSGHWEITGLPVMTPPQVFEALESSFPTELLNALISKGDLPGILGDKHASGVPVIRELGEEHMRTGKPIVYTSADSVLQIAAHEESFGLDQLYDLCRIAREICDGYRVGRIIARPFVGTARDDFERTGNRRDFTMPPPEDTILDTMTAAGRQVMAMGKISDIYAGRGISETRKTHGNMPLFDLTLDALDELQEGGLLFANFVDFDTEFGHARDPLGYAKALEEFDERLPELFAKMAPEDLLVITADHGNDPTWSGTDHTREQVPILIKSETLDPAGLGIRPFADIGATIADYLGVPGTAHGTSVLPLLGEKQ
ncbi:phosphopentomutase [Ruegeria sp. 2205SS24-7]|uniref:phosphopentomutase n=1 Tax=Ruegeria discodermiae TaxID=3064389 RepID=UPI002741D731|nr:phosphopentomutase [Ruegeria sp. 2205SS24-7]MDP5217078.1 phosphopentomutase [Ruegeria sp. 2205SS24-7]